MEEADISIQTTNGAHAPTEPDPELAAIQSILRTMTGLDEGQRERVFAYVQQRFGIGASPQITANGADTDPAKIHAEERTPTTSDEEESTWTDFGEVFYAFEPKSNAEKLLVSGYWLQEVQGQESFTSFEANKLLKDMGAGIPKNIARDFERLVKEKPSRVIMLTRGGSGRNKYKLTVPGVRSVNDRAKAAFTES